MRIAKEELNLRVVVRRVATGSSPFQWEVSREESASPLQVSPERFKGMEAAYKAGQTWLTNFIATQRSSARKRVMPLPLARADIDAEFDFMAG